MTEPGPLEYLSDEELRQRIHAMYTDFLDTDVGAASRSEVATGVDQELATVGAIHRPGTDFIVKQAEQNPGALLTLPGRIIPREVDAKVEGVSVKWPLPRSAIDG